MSQLDKAGIKATGGTLFNDNTNEEITPERERTMVDNYADSFGVLNDTANITGDWTYSNPVNVPLTPTADAHAISKKYFDDNASPATGDVTGTSSSLVNEIPTYSDTTGKAIQDGSGVGLDSSGNFTSVGNITFSTATNTLGGIQVGNLLDKSVNQTVSAGWTFSSNVTVPILPIATTDATSKDYVDGLIGGGDVSKVGTPVNNQLGVWTGDGTIEGDANVTWDGSTFSVGGNFKVNDGKSINFGGKVFMGIEDVNSDFDIQLTTGYTLELKNNGGDNLTVLDESTGNWDFQDNSLEGIGQATIDNIVLNGNDISTSSGDLTLNPSGNFLVQSGNADFSNDVSIDGIFNIGATTDLTISSGSVTITKSHHTLIGEGGVADNLDTIVGGSEGDVLFLRADSGSVDITITEAGNIKLNTSGNFVMDNGRDIIQLMYDVGFSRWLEISRSNNGI